MPVFLRKALLSDDKMINPESQNTGMAISSPVKFKANGDLPEPITLMRVCARRLVAPDFSRKVPMMLPKAMMIPILDKVLPNP